MRIGAIGLAMLACAGSATAEPVREMSTDRPDKTESPYTVPSGWFQIEADLIARTRDRAPTEVRRDLAIGAINLKRGLDQDTDIQFVFAPYLQQRASDRATGTTKRASGVGDLTIRLKRNLWGNDAGNTALALMPFVTLPTGSNGLGTGDVEGGLIVPLSVTLADGIGLGLMTEIDIIRDPRGRGHVASFINSATLGLDLTDRLSIYTEIFGEKAAHARWIATFDTGVTFAATGDLQLDAGANIGLTEAADDLTLFLGISYRF